MSSPTFRRPTFMAVLLSLFSMFSHADSLLNGLALHSELNKSVFIGALYTNTLSSSQKELLNDTGAKRMELRVTASRLSSRRLNSIWIEGMAINNPHAMLAEEASNMAEFASMVKRPLKSGDRLSIHNISNETSVSLNGVRLGVIQSPQFFTMLLRTWIGPVPLSSSFRSNLLTDGKVDSALLAQFESLEPTESRKAAIAKWNTPKTESATETQTTQAKTINPSIAAPEIAPPIVTKPLFTTPSAETSTTAQSAAPVSTPVSSEPEAPLTTATAVPKKQVAVTTKETKAKTTPPAQKPMEDKPLEDEMLDEEEAGPELTAESLLALQKYHSSLVRWTYKYISYPSRAVKRNQDGSVRLGVTIDRSGKVIALSEIESSEHNLLNEAARSAVEDASPFPAMPAEMSGDSFNFSLPIVFRLPD